jgi:hypothetical protein
MTEEQWLDWTRPLEMLGHLRGQATDRKLRLFVCACCRRIWPLLTDGRSQRAVEVAERHADGEASDQELEAAWRDAEKFFGSTCSYGTSTGDQPARAASSAADPTPSLLPHMHHLSFRYLSEEWPAQATLLRDIFGNPFRPVTLDPTWRTSTVVALASQMYDSRDFGATPILADALQDAGCDSADVLDHCRAPNGVHVRGCWVVDLVLAKS